MMNGYFQGKYYYFEMKISTVFSFVATFKGQSFLLLSFKQSPYFWMYLNARDATPCLENFSPLTEWQRNLSDVFIHLKYSDSKLLEL